MQHHGHIQFKKEKKKVFKFCLEKQKGCTETVCSTLTGRVRTAAGALVLHPASQWAEISGMTGISIHSNTPLGSIGYSRIDVAGANV